MMNPKTVAAVLILAGLASTTVPAVARVQPAPSADGASRAGSNAGSSALTSTRAPAVKPSKHVKKSSAWARSHRLPANATGMGSQAANTTGVTSNSH